MGGAATALLATAAIGGLFWAATRGKGNGKTGTVFPNVPDAIAFQALGLQLRAGEACPDQAAQIEALGGAFAISAGAGDPEGALIQYAQEIAAVCPGVGPDPGDEALGRSFYAEVTS